MFLLFPEQRKRADPQHLCGVSQRDQRQRADQRPGGGRHSHTPPHYPQ